MKTEALCSPPIVPSCLCSRVSIFYWQMRCPLSMHFPFYCGEIVSPSSPLLLQCKNLITHTASPISAKCMWRALQYICWVVDVRASALKPLLAPRWLIKSYLPLLFSHLWCFTVCTCPEKMRISSCHMTLTHTHGEDAGADPSCIWAKAGTPLNECTSSSRVLQKHLGIVDRAWGVPWPSSEGVLAPSPTSRAASNLPNRGMNPQPLSVQTPADRVTTKC